MYACMSQCLISTFSAAYYVHFRYPSHNTVISGFLVCTQRAITHKTIDSIGTQSLMCHVQTGQEALKRLYIVTQFDGYSACKLSSMLAIIIVHSSHTSSPCPHPYRNITELFFLSSYVGISYTITQSTLSSSDALHCQLSNLFPVCVTVVNLAHQFC